MVLHAKICICKWKQREHKEGGKTRGQAKANPKEHTLILLFSLCFIPFTFFAFSAQPPHTLITPSLISETKASSPSFLFPFLFTISLFILPSHPPHHTHTHILFSEKIKISFLILMVNIGLNYM